MVCFGLGKPVVYASSAVSSYDGGSGQQASVLICPNRQFLLLKFMRIYDLILMIFIRTLLPFFISPKVGKKYLHAYIRYNKVHCNTIGNDFLNVNIPVFD